MWASKCKNGMKNIYVIFIQIMSFLLVMFWCEVRIIYILINLCNYCDVILITIMRLLCIKYEHSLMSFKNNVLLVWILKILNTYKYHSSDFCMNLWKLDFCTNLWSLVGFMMFDIFYLFHCSFSYPKPYFLHFYFFYYYYL
jgi:hypothetical protein